MKTDIRNVDFEKCIKCGICTTYCPVTKASPTYPGPKQLGPDGERHRVKLPLLTEDTIKNCTGCKTCEVVCPSEIPIAHIIDAARNSYSGRKKGMKGLRNFVMARTYLLGLSSFMPHIVNNMLKVRWVKYLMDKIMHIDKARSFPTYRWGTFYHYYKRHYKKAQNKFDKKVLYFRGCAVNFQEHDLGKSVIKVMNALGYGVESTKEQCCGVPLVANGYINTAIKHAKFNIKHLSAALPEKNTPIISASSSCSLMIKNEYNEFLKQDNSSIAENFNYVCKFVYNEFEKGNIPEMKPLNFKIAYHTPCHLQKMGAQMYSIEILKKIPGLEVDVLPQTCCGSAGTFTFKSENHEISQGVGDVLFGNINNSDPQYVITDCETCKWQVEAETKYKVLHPIALLALAVK